MSNAGPQLNDPRRFWGLGEVLYLAAPTSLAMVNVTLMQFIDGLMVARIQPNGPEALSAQFAAGMFSFVPSTLMLGTLAVINTFVAQNFGARRLDRCGQYAWQGLYMGWAWWLLLLGLIPLAPALFGLVGHAPAVQAMEVMYFRYIIAAEGIMLASRVIERFFYGVHRPAVVYVSSLVANVVNILGDWVLIFGKWGFPAMGLHGAAIATVAGMAAGLAILAAAFLSPAIARQFGTRRQWRLHGGQIREIWRVGWPAGMQFFLDMLGWGLCITVLVGSIDTVGGEPLSDAGTVHLTATSVVMRYMRLSFMPAVGIGLATTALVGKYIGAGRMHLVKRRVGAAVVLGVAYMGLCGLAFWLLRYPMVRWFVSLDPLKGAQAAAQLEMIVGVGAKVMICAAVFQVFDGVGIVYIGALRGAGDTLWPMVVSGVLAGVIVLGGGTFMLAVLPGLESVGVWIAGSAFVISLGVAMCLRFQSGRWQRINLLEGREAPAATNQR
ncbi:MAG: MATE family efflux transporter [Planctomycetes bacterium]|nr:MATE family efflux transporter [Planctomycetota bacterium]